MEVFKMRANIGVMRGSRKSRTIKVPASANYVRILAKKGTKVSLEFKKKKI
jgi:hypothetical protein